MHDALLVRGFESITYLRCDPQSFFERVRTSRSLALDVLHHQIVRSDIVNLADVGMIQRGDGLGLTLKALRELCCGDLNGHVAIQPGIVRSIHFAHPAFPDGRKELVRSEFVAWLERHMSDLAQCTPIRKCTAPG
jgi:hypothetical protein